MDKSIILVIYIFALLPLHSCILQELPGLYLGIYYSIKTPLHFGKQMEQQILHAHMIFKSHGDTPFLVFSHQLLDSTIFRQECKKY